jgi:hypothetical protein
MVKGTRGSMSSEVKETERYHQPTSRECALLVLRLLQVRQEEINERKESREVSRARISQSTIRKLSGRSQVPTDFLIEVQEFLLAAGWALFCIGPTHYAIIKLKAVRGWARTSSNRIDDELKAVARGKYDFAALEKLLLLDESEADEGDE